MIPPKQYTTLVADDVAALRKLIRIAVEGSGRFKVIAEASTGAEAIELAGSHSPELVLLDLSMPEMDGLEALPHVLEASPSSRVVVLSGFNHIRMAPIAMRMGASAYLEKGIEPEEIVRRLLAVLEPQGVASAPGTGAPSETGAAGPGSSLGAVLAETVVPKGTGSSVALRRFRILVLEAHPGKASRLAKALRNARSANFEADIVATLPDCLESLRAGSYDLVLADALGTGKSTEDCLIDVLTRAPHIPVVALAPPGDAEFEARAMKLGIEDCLAVESHEPNLLGRSLLYAIERRRAHEARRLARDQEAEVGRLRELEALKIEFFNAAAHELGTPLTPIKLQLHLLKTMDTGLQTPLQQKSIEILDRNVERLAKLTHELLDVARLQAGHLKVEKQPTDLRSIVREVADSFEPIAIAQGIAFDVSGAGNEVADVDARRITQVLYNLVNNAIKFTSRGGRVTVESTVNDRECALLVHDTGIGLRADQIQRLFQPFSQVHEGAVAPGSGTGLGLFVSRGIIELHGGRIWCESPGPGKGSTFAFAVPRYGSPEARDQEPPLFVSPRVA